MGGIGGGNVELTKEEKKKNRNSKLLRNFGAMFRLGSGGAGSKERRRDISNPSSSSLPHSQSMPLSQQQQEFKTSRSGIC